MLENYNSFCFIFELILVNDNGISEKTLKCIQQMNKYLKGKMSTVNSEWAVESKVILFFNS